MAAKNMAAAAADFLRADFMGAVGMLRIVADGGF
jgi:hypothetical protein